jgi:hypothetical protein
VQKKFRELNCFIVNRSKVDSGLALRQILEKTCEFGKVILSLILKRHKGEKKGKAVTLHTMEAQGR